MVQKSIYEENQQYIVSLVGYFFSISKWLIVVDQKPMVCLESNISALCTTSIQMHI